MKRHRCSWSGESSHGRGHVPHQHPPEHALPTSGSDTANGGGAPPPSAMESLVLALLRSHQPVRGLDVDERRATVHLSAGNFVVRLPVPVPLQWREAETPPRGEACSW